MAMKYSCWNYITNSFLTAEVYTAIKEIQNNIDKIKVCLWPNTPRSLTLAAGFHLLQDIRRHLETHLECDTNPHTTTGTEERNQNQHGGHEGRTTPEPYQ
jgi:hypothetical protein